jgi:hypothetical protein
MGRRGVFPEKVSLRSLAVGSLSRVVRSGSERVAVYELEPIDDPEYAACTESLRGVDGLRFSPLPGVWSSYRITDLPKGDARLDLYVGLDESVLSSHLAAMSSVGSSRSVVVPDFLVRALAFGYLEKIGA